jgi:hypothetical protein
MMKKLKGDCFIETESIFSTEVPHQYQILLYQEGIKNHPNNRPNLIKESASH